MGRLMSGILLLLGFAFVKGQSEVWLQDNQVYIYPPYPATYSQTVNECNGFNAKLASLDNELVRNKSIEIRNKRNFEGDALWIPRNTGTTGGICQYLNLTTGVVGQMECSEKLPHICVADVWRNLTDRSGDKFGFSNVKLRYLDSLKICELKGEEYGLAGALVTVTSESLQNYLTTFTQQTTGGYLISNDNANLTKTNGYHNWVPEKSPPDLEDQCYQMKPNGKWDNSGCYGQTRFICQWKPVVTTTIGTDTIEETTTEMPKTTKMLQKTALSTQPTDVATDIMTTAMLETTSGSAMINYSFNLIILLVITWNIFNV